MAQPVDDFTPEELRLAERLLDERVRSASREQYRQMVAANDPNLHRGPVKLSREVIQQLRDDVAVEIRTRRTPSPATNERRRWPWQRG